MNSIKNKTLIFFKIILLSGCQSPIFFVSSIVDHYFMKNRIKTFCARSVIELYELDSRVMPQLKNTQSLLFTKEESSQLSSYKKSILNIYSKKNRTEDDFNNLVSIEKKILENNKGLKTLTECIGKIKNQKKCTQKKDQEKISCINFAQRKFTLQKIKNSQIASLFPDEYLKQMNMELDELKNYFLD